MTDPISANPRGGIEIAPTQVPTDAWQLYEEKRKRESSTSTGDYFGAMWRQDSPVDGLVAHAVGRQFAPDPTYAPFEPKEYERLTAGIPEEFHKEFYSATSREHADFIRMRLEQKVDDLQKLGDLGFAGNAGRLLFGFVEPTNLLAGVASGGVASLALGTARAARNFSRARTTAAVEGALTEMQAAATRAASPMAMTAGLTSAALMNAGFEKVRQAVNFEDDTGAVVEAAVIGTLFATPFVALNSREWQKVAQAADLDRRAIGVARRIHAGEALDDADRATIREINAAHARIEEVETGRTAPGVIYVDPDGVATRQADRVLYVDSVGRASDRMPEDKTGMLGYHIETLRADLRKELKAVVDQNRAAGPEVKPQDPLTGDDLIRQAARIETETKAFAAQKRAIANLLELRGERLSKRLQKLQAESKVAGPDRRVAEQAKAEKLAAKLEVDLRQGDYERALASLEARKQAELDALQAEGKAAPEEVAMAKDALARDVRELRAEGADRSAPAKADDVGTEVFWRDLDGRADGGVVVGRSPSGKLKIDLYASLPPGTRPASGNRYKFLRPDELDYDSPLYQDPADIEGFGSNTAGSAQAGGTSIERADVSPDVDNPTEKAKYRFDIFARLNSSSNPAVRELAHLMVKDAIGNSKEWAQRETVTEKKRRLQRIYGGQFHWTAREAFNAASKDMGLGFFARAQYHRMFYEDVSRAVRGEELFSPQAAHPHIERAAAAMREVYAELAKLARKSGLEGAENLAPDQLYVNRVWNHNNIRTAIQTHGEDAVVRVIADAIRVPGHTGDVEKARKFLKTVMKLEFSPVLQDIQLHARDLVTLRRELEASRLSKSEIDDLVDTLFEVQEAANPDAGRPANLKFRFDLDETTTLDLPTGELRLTDLVENDSRLLVDRYLNAMGGHIALAERGIKSQSDFRARLEDARRYHAENESTTTDATRFNDELQILEDMNSYVIGRPMSVTSFNRIDRVLGAFRAYSRSVFLGQLGVAAAFELKNAVGLATFRAFMDQMPTFRGMIQALRSGRLPNRELAQDIEQISGFGLERAASYARQNEITDFTYDRGLNRAENAANTVSHAVDIISGNNFVTSATRQFSAAMMVQKMHNMATGKLKLDESRITRLVHNGIDRGRLQDVLNDLKQYTTVDQKGAVREIDHETWLRESPKTFQMFQTALTREVRDAIQDHDIGETGMWMHTTIGKFFSELRTFNLAAHSKQFLKGLSYLDRTTAVTWTLSFAGECLAYSLQTALNFAHNPDELAKRLEPDAIWRAALQRMSVLGISSYLFDTGHFVLTGEPMFKKGGTTNTDNRNLFLTPSIMAANRLLNTAVGTTSALNPFSTDVITKQNAKDMMSVLPGGNTWLMRNVNDYVSSQFPKRELNAQQ